MYMGLLLPLLLFSFVKKNECKLQAVSENQVLARVSLSRCIIEACKRFFTSDFETVTFSLPLEQVDRSLNSALLMNHLLFPVLQREYRWTFFIKNLKLPVLTFDSGVSKSYSYIIHIRKEGELTENLEKLKEFLSWNPHAKFLVISVTVFADPHSVAVEAIRTLWTHNVASAVVLLPDKKNTTKFNVYSWQPYNTHSCANNFSTVSCIDSCYFGGIQKNKNWFEEKTKRAYNCSVKVNYIKRPPFVNMMEDSEVTTYKNQGIDINLLNMIADYLDVHLVYNRSAYGNWGILFENGTATKDLKHLLQNEVDVLAGGYGQTYPRALYLDCSYSYIQESLVWCVPHEPVAVGYAGLVHVDVAVLIVLVYFIMTLLTWYSSTYEERGTYKGLINCLQSYYSMLIGFAVNVLPRTHNVRRITAMFVMFSLILNCFYTSYLTSVLSTQRYAEKYGKMGDIYKYNLKTYFVPNSIRFIQSYKGDTQINNVPVSLIMARWNNCSRIRTCLSDVATRKDSAVCISRLYKQFMANNVEDIRNKMTSIFCMKESVISFPVNILMRKGFPLYVLFNDVLKRIISAGFIAKWEKDNLEDRRKENGKPSNYITFKNLQPVFRMVFLGHLISIVAFVGEKILYRKRVQTKKLHSCWSIWNFLIK